MARNGTRYTLIRSVERTPGGNAIFKTIEASGVALQLFSKADRNRIVRDAVWQGGEYWRVTFLPLRFKEYARRLGYRAGAKYTAMKKLRTGDALPAVLTGESRKQAIDTSKVEARATATKFSATIRFRNTKQLSMNRMLRGVVRSLLPEEVDRVAKVIGKAMTSDLEMESEVKNGRKMLAQESRRVIDLRSKRTNTPRSPKRGTPRTP